MRLFALLALLGAGCATPLPEDFDPNRAGTTLDEAAVNCLDWVWYHKSFLDEVAGGLVKTIDGYACDRLFVGNRLRVRVIVSKDWVAMFHTHVIPNSQVSKRDMHNAREDPLHRPEYIRLHNGTVIAYECRVTKEGKVKCAGRRVRG